MAEDEPVKDEKAFQDQSEITVKSVDENISASTTLTVSGETDSIDAQVVPSFNDENLSVCEISTIPAPLIQTVVDPISSKLAAIHHVSQAIKSLRWKRQLQSTESELDHTGRMKETQPLSMDFSVCACGDTDCIEVCDIREWLPTSKLDDKLWKLVLLLGESYLALGQAYKDADQLHQTLKVVELACLVYGSMPQHLKDTRFISSMLSNSSSEIEINGRTVNNSDLNDDCFAFERVSSTYLFWAKAWTLVGDVYVEFHMIKGNDLSIQTEKKSSIRELKMSSEVFKEVERLKKKLGKFNQNCSLCSLVNCSCQSDRASSGSSASSSGGTRPLVFGRKQSKKSFAKNIPHSANSSESSHLKHNKGDSLEEDSELVMDADDNSLPAENGSRERKEKNGGIFKYIQGSVSRDADYNLSAALSCYEEARKALGGRPTWSDELQSVVKKKGWVCNELGRIRLGRKELDKAELAFVEAVKSFKKVSDHTNIILIYCNLGHGRRALAEEMVAKIQSLKKHAVFRNAYAQALETAKLEYCESLRYEAIGFEDSLHN